ncbi:MAG TPA: RloB family protein [Chthoniobacterales bacterium]|nr:RloB family protein [Chthoniobacterales bacterium]
MTEDKYAPKQYFSIFSHPRLKIEVFGTQDSKSAPAHVKTRLSDVRRNYQLHEENGDQLWLVLDKDHWMEISHRSSTLRALSGYVGRAQQQKVQIATSNPCFEVWLLLHFDDLTEPEKAYKCTEIEHKIRSTGIPYNKSNLPLKEFTRARIEDAVKRAKLMDEGETQWFPEKCCTRIYKIVELLLNRHLISPT